MMFFPRPTFLVFARSLMHRRGKARVASPTAPTACDHDPLVGSRKIVHFLTRIVVVHNCPYRNLQHHVAAIAPGFVRTFSVTSALRVVFRIESEMHQRIVPFARL